MYLFPVQHNIPSSTGGEENGTLRKEFHIRKVRGHECGRSNVACCLTQSVTNVFIRKGCQKRLQTKACSSKSKGLLPPFLPFYGPPSTPFGQYIDPIIAATWSEDGAIHDVCRALAPRFREPNSIVSSLLSSPEPPVG